MAARHVIGAVNKLAGRMPWGRPIARARLGEQSMAVVWLNLVASTDSLLLLRGVGDGDRPRIGRLALARLCCVSVVPASRRQGHRTAVRPHPQGNRL